MNRDSLSITDLACMAALFELGSVTLAASRLGVSQPALSHALGRLRTHFGDPLFVRIGNMMEPTARAELLREPVSAALRAIERIDDTADFAPESCERVFRIATADFVQGIIVPALAVRLAEAVPRARLAVVPAGQGRDLFRGSDIDIVISLRAIAQPNFRARNLFHERYLVIARTDHPLTADGLTLEDYVAARHVLVSPRGQGFQGPVDDALAELGTSRTVSLAVTSFWTAAEVVSRSDLLATVPAGFYAQCQGRFPIAGFPLPLTIPDFALTIFWHEKYQNDPAHVWLRRLIVEIAAERGSSGA